MNKINFKGNKSFITTLGKFFSVILLLVLDLESAYALSSLSRRDVFIQSTTAAVVSSSGVVERALLGNDNGIHQISANAIETPPVEVSSSPPSIDGTYLMSEYYNNAPVTAASKGRFYFPALTPPFRNRATYRYELGRNSWAFEQLLTFANVTATIKMNVVKLENGGLWVHSPQWPTGELMYLLDELGPVEHIVLPCNAFEHAAPVKEFTKKYKSASVWVAPGQYGPFGSCGRSLQEPCSLGYHIDGILGMDSKSDSESTSPPLWLDEFDYKTLYVNLPENAGPVSEVAFFHKPTKTFVATDAVIYIADTPSPIFSTYFEDDGITLDPTFWPKTVLQSVFLPLRADETTGRYSGYDAIQGRLLRAPILRGFNDARAPGLTRKWIEDICSSWEFDRVITSHFASPIGATPRNVKNTFSFLDEGNDSSTRKDMLPPITCEDWGLLDGLNDFIAENKIGAPATFDYRKDCK